MQITKEQKAGKYQLPPLPVKRNGDFYKITGCKKKIGRLIKNECCNYVNGECLVLEECCPQCCMEILCCKWFCSAVLPLKPQLEILILGKRELKHCVICKGKFVPGSNRQKYCEVCAVKIHRLQKREYKRKAAIK